jgi:hypothetical protein
MKRSVKLTCAPLEISGCADSGVVAFGAAPALGSPEGKRLTGYTIAYH